MTATEPQRIRAQPGPQRAFLASRADIAIFGGAAGGGKSFSLLMEPLRWVSIPSFDCVMFRRTMPQIRAPGALWDQSEEMYSLVGANGSSHTLTWTFPKGSQVRFSHMENDKDRFSWQGSQIALLCWDELTHFSAKQFWYLTSRSRSPSGVRPYMRATTNPDADSWVAKFIQWWWDPETGYAIPERAGKLRWMIRTGDELQWADSPEELISKHSKAIPKSVTFIPSLLEDNQILMRKDPGYLSNLLALPLVEREQLLKGNWKIRPKAGLYFQRAWFKEINRSEMPLHNRTVRCWDRASTEQKDANDPDWTAGPKVSVDQFNTFYIEDMQRFRGSPATVEKAIQNIASQDGPYVEVVLSQDPGQAGKAEVGYHVRNLAGYQTSTVPEVGDKVLRAGAASSLAEHGRICVVRGPWNQAFYDELEAFPTPGVKDDQVDGLSLAINRLTNMAAKPVPVMGRDTYSETMERRRDRSMDG